jgi:hypothetical protein
VELLAADPVRTAAMASLRSAERTGGAGPLILSAHPAVTARVAARPDWIESLARRIGASVVLQAVPDATISGGHAARRHP